MNFDKDNPHPLDGKAPVAWHAKPPPGRSGVACPPHVPEILASLVQNYCTAQLGDNCYVIVNKKGDAIELLYGVPVQDWLDAIRQLGSYEANEPIERADLHSAADD